MPRIIDFKTKIEEFRRILIKYHGIPSVKEDRVAYANLNYYLKHHNKEPGIKSLIDEFNLEIPKHNSKEDSLKIRLIEIRTILEKYGRIPKDNNDYNKVYYFFNHYRDEPEVSKLMYVYAHPDCYKYVVGKPLTVRSNGSCKYACDDKSAYKYVKYVFENYNQLPARNSAPMKKVFMEIGRYKIVSKKFKYPVQYKFKSLFTFLQEMKELGCNDKNLLGIINEQSV